MLTKNVKLVMIVATVADVLGQVLGMLWGCLYGVWDIVGVFFFINVGMSWDLSGSGLGTFSDVYGICLNC